MRKGGRVIAVHANVETVNALIRCAFTEAGELEIACYNSQESQVVAGSDASIAKFIASLKNIKNFQKLDVSYGFYSRLCDGLLGELNEVAQSPDFRRANILLETCTREQVSVISPLRIGQHTRGPVFFQWAIERLEQKFGDCVWLEAGAESSIIPMVKRVTSNTTNRHFHFNLGLGRIRYHCSRRSRSSYDDRTSQ